MISCGDGGPLGRKTLEDHVEVDVDASDGCHKRLGAAKQLHLHMPIYHDGG